MNTDNYEKNFNNNKNSKLLISKDDEEFIAKWADTTLEFEKWTHRSHIRMAYIIINKLYPDKDNITNTIREGIKRFNNKNIEKIVLGYHETITIFWIDQVFDAVKKHIDETLNFEQFIEIEKQLLASKILFQYYSKEYLFKEEAKIKYFPPDLKQVSI